MCLAGAHAHADDGRVAEHDGLFLAAPDDGEPRLFLDELSRLECDWLEVPLRTAGLEACRPVTLRHVLRCRAMPRAASIPALERIVGEEPDVRPPALRRSCGVRQCTGE